MRFFRRKKFKTEDPFIIKIGSMGTSKLKTSSRLDWTEEAFLGRKGSSETIGKNFELNKISKIFYIFIALLLIIIGRTGWLQVVKNDYYYELAQGNRIRVERIEPKRGIIYDRTYNPLVRNIANFMLYLIPADLPKDESAKEAIYNRISEILGTMQPADLKNIVSPVKLGSLESYQPLFILDNIEYEKAMLLYLESTNMPGVILSNKTRREYNLYSLSLSHILGYTGKISPDELKKFGNEYSPIDYIGKSGIEYFWENELRGINGKKQIEVDALGKEKKIINQENGEDGHNLVLSLDINLQKKLEDTIIASLQKSKLNRGCAIAMDPNNGEILAMISFPSYNNNIFAKGISAEDYSKLASYPDAPLLNRCISGQYPSGSTIKPVIAAAALEEKIINVNTSFISNGGLKVGEWFFPDWKAGGHGITDVRKALAESVNTFFYYIGGGYDDFTGLGVDRIDKYAKLFNLGSQTGIDMIGESQGFLPTKEWKETTKGEKWYIGDTYHLSIGQGDLLVTPLQVANYTAVFANGGYLYRPHFIHQVLTGDDKLIGEIENKPIRSGFVSQNNIEIVRQGMRQTVTAGSAQSLQSAIVSVAGKTGTAQWSSTKNNHAWFTGFAPYDNPKLVLTILIEEGGEGSSIAVPIAHEVFDWYFSQENNRNN